MLSSVLQQHSYLYLLHYIVVHTQKQIHRWFFWRKSARDTGRFENGNSLQEKEMEPKQWCLLKIFPKPAKMLHVLQCEFFLKTPL